MVAPASMVDVKEQNVVIEEVFGSGSELTSIAFESCEALKRTLKPVCLLYEDSLMGLL